MLRYLVINSQPRLLIVSKGSLPNAHRSHYDIVFRNLIVILMIRRQEMCLCPTSHSADKEFVWPDEVEIESWLAVSKSHG